MNRRLLIATLVLCLCCAGYPVQAQEPVSSSAPAAQTGAKTASRTTSFLAALWKEKRAGFKLMRADSTPSAAAFNNTPGAAAGSNQVFGSGTVGRLTKWTGFSSSSSSIGDSSIFEDKFGMVGVGTNTPTSKLTVAGTIQSTTGGFKFPDGTVQMSAGLTSVPAPLDLTASTSVAIISGTNTGTGPGVFGQGGPAAPTGNEGGTGVLAFGGTTHGGGTGGVGLFARGGPNASSTNGPQPGIGVRAFGGGSFIVGDGASGVVAIGGDASGGGHVGGPGIEVNGGQGFDGATAGLAGRFFGNVSILGNLSKSGGSFKIDHPLDPENKYLYHSFVESPDMKNIYDGTTVTGANGDAVVQMPDYFEALNRDFRYQLTVIGAFAQAIVAEEISGNRFKIKTSAPGVKVSWQVTGVRQDAWANKNRIKVEAEKDERERGFYLHPEVFSQPEERGIQWAHQPEFMKEMKQRREEFERTRANQTANKNDR